MLANKAMIIIAVSNYNGGLMPLPGTVKSAQRLDRWARDENYNVLYLGDDKHNPITVALLTQEIPQFIFGQIIDRLVVYFAGHGVVRSASDQFWLLTNAYNDTREGINVEAFRRGLLKCNIGKHNTNLSGQICLIGDACRRNSSTAIDFIGDPILTNNNCSSNTRIQFDRFFATQLGGNSYHVTNGNSNKCLFTETLLEALNGKIEKAIERQFHRYKPAVINTKLADYLESELPKISSSHGIMMQPDIKTAIRPDFNYYKLVTADSDPELIDLNNCMGTNIKTDCGEQHFYKVDRIVIGPFSSYKWTPKINPKSLPSDRASGLTARCHYVKTLCDFRPPAIAIPCSANVRIHSKSQFNEVLMSNRYGSPLLVQQQNNSWLIVPHYPNTLSVLLKDMPGDALIYKPTDQTWDAFLSDYAMLSKAPLLKVADALRYAQHLRYNKEVFPHHSVIAGYLYEFANDYNNIRRTAHYMKENINIVPFDLALLCAEEIVWKKIKKNRVVAFANIPSVPKERTSNTSLPQWTCQGFSAKQNVKLWGIAPIYSQGWTFLKTEKHLNLPNNIQEICTEVGGRSASNLTEKGIEVFLEIFNYKIIHNPIDIHGG